MEEEQADLFSEVRDLVAAGRTADAVTRLDGVHRRPRGHHRGSGRGHARRADSIHPQEELARIVEYLPEAERRDIIEEIGETDLAPLLDEIDDDIAVDILHELPASEPTSCSRR